MTADAQPRVSFGGRWTYGVIALALLFVLMPFLFWNATWFGRPLTDDQLAKALGVSALHGYARFDCLQPQYSLVCRSIEREILPICRSENVGVIAWSPLGGGFLSGKYRSGEGAPQASR